ncbi:MAG: mannitol dehydrogenase family protein [Chloroflexi bacterium]|nr:mannitol dehydrogenase family protein [Chloroflexota bacterium]MBV9546464.1 mannitol dehydrogenase family protein [Chloroflexota bacterium]
MAGTHAAAARGLSHRALREFGRAIAVPTYARGDLRPAIVHLGVGGFHRAHQALYLDELAQQRVSMDWGERGVGLLAPDKRMADALLPQECLYTLVERSAEHDSARVVGSLLEYAFAPDDPGRVLEMLADPQTTIVSLTITEGGYLVDDKTGVFDANDASVHADTDPAAPKTAFGYLCSALARRRAAGTPPFTVMSCDNLQGNGRVARTAVVSFANLRDSDLAKWIESNVAFPNAMVDRITPQTTDADRAMVTQTFGIVDAWPVVAEPFKQWVIEDTFTVGRPPVEEVGAQIVPDVHPYETMKLRLLNGSHQALAYLGYLAGHRYVHEAAADPALQKLIRRMMDEEVTPLLAPVPGVDLTDYKRSLLERFQNPKIRDTLARLAFAGSDRMPKFLLPSIADALTQGRPHRLLTLATAGWLRYLRGVDDQGEAIVVQDDRADELRRLANAGGSDPRPLLSARRVFGDLGSHEEWVAELEIALRNLDARGARAVLHDV